MRWSQASQPGRSTPTIWRLWIGAHQGRAPLSAAGRSPSLPAIGRHNPAKQNQRSAYDPEWSPRTPVFGPDPTEAFESVKAKAQCAENHGFIWFSVMDHLIQIGGVGAPDVSATRPSRVYRPERWAVAEPLVRGLSAGGGSHKRTRL